MRFPKLIADPNTLEDVQHTTLSRDTLAGDLTNTLDEALAGGKQYDIVVVGSGMYGAYAASKFFRLGGDTRPSVLVVEAGPFLLPEHIQNFSYRLGYEVFRGVTKSPYLSMIKEPNADSRSEWVADHYYCVGGKSLGWGKWCPRMTENDLAQWPDEVAQSLRENYPITELEIGVKPYSDFINGPLFDALFRKCNNVVDQINGLDNVEPPPIAAQSSAAGSGLYSFDAYSSLPLLLDSIRDDIRSHGPDPVNRKLVLVPNTRIYRMETEDGNVNHLNLLIRRPGTVENESEYSQTDLSVQNSKVFLVKRAV